MEVSFIRSFPHRAHHGWSPSFVPALLQFMHCHLGKPRSWQMLSHLVVMSAFACRWWIVGGCVAAVLWWMLCHRDRVAWWMLCHLWLLRAWRVLCRHSFMFCRYGCAFRWMLRHHLLLRVGDSFLCRSSSLGGLCLGGLFGVYSPSCFFCCLFVVVAYCEFVCIFSSVFLFR